MQLRVIASVHPIIRSFHPIEAARGRRVDAPRGGSLAASWGSDSSFAPTREQAELKGFALRAPRATDAGAIWQLVREAGALDANSVYAYLLLCTDFSETSIVAESFGQVVGFVLGYRPPRRRDTLFVWQVAVAPERRAEGVAAGMLDALLARCARTDVRFLEATVTPSNGPSRALFEGLARRNAAPCREGVAFESDLFPGGSHEPELMLRIGPFPR